MIPTYWIAYGPANFLWFSDVSLFLTYLAVMGEVPLLASMAAVGGLVLESLWIIDFFLILLFDIHWIHLVDYMFNSSLALPLRGISFFHLLLPPLYIYLIRKLGYDKRAWLFQSALMWMLLLLTWILTNPEKNINWVFNYRKIERLSSSPGIYLVGYGLLLMTIFALTHFFLLLIAPKQVKVNSL